MATGNENDRAVLPQLRPPMAEALRRLAGFRGALAATSLGLAEKARSVTLARLERAGLVERAGLGAHNGRRPPGMWRATPLGRLLVRLVARWERATAHADEVARLARVPLAGRAKAAGL